LEGSARDFAASLSFLMANPNRRRPTGMTEGTVATLSFRAPLHG